MNDSQLNQLASVVIRSITENTEEKIRRGIRVNPIVSEIATWYEKLRNAMDYRDDEVILRAAIERILKRRLIFGGSGSSVAEPLIRELMWARYFPDGSIPENVIDKVAEIINLYLSLRKSVIDDKKIAEDKINTWIIHVLSSHIEHILNPNIIKETISNFMYQVLKDNVAIKEDGEEAKNAQVFIAVRRSYAKDDQALLRYQLFNQYFGELTSSNLSEIVSKFTQGFEQIENHLNYKLRHRIFFRIKRLTPPFLILEDLLKTNKDRIHELLADKNELNKTIFALCQKHYDSIASKVRRAVVRSVIFILLSKTFFALAIEGSFEKYAYGSVLWDSIILNVLIPPILMIIAGLFIRTPGRLNSLKIINRIESLMFDPNPRLGSPITLSLKRDKSRPVLNTIFTLMWLVAFISSFGLIIYTLTNLHFNLVSQGVFIFFLAIVAFLTYRIYRIAHTYTVEDQQTLLTPIIDFFFMPIAQVGRYLTEGISQINVFVFILDFIIETPFKGMFSFAEQWFLFLHSKRENLE